MDGVANEEDYDQYGNPMREDDDDDEVYVTHICVSIGVGVAEVDVAEDPRQRYGGKDASLKFDHGADAGHDLLKRLDQEGNQLGGAFHGSGKATRRGPITRPQRTRKGRSSM